MAVRDQYPIRVIENGTKYTGIAIYNYLDHLVIQESEMDGTSLHEIDELSYTEFSRIKTLLVNQFYLEHPELHDRDLRRSVAIDDIKADGYFTQ